MNAPSFSGVARESIGIISDEPKPNKPLDTAWIVLEAANDLGDDATVEACRRVIDANLKGTPAALTSMSSAAFDGMSARCGLRGRVAAGQISLMPTGYTLT
jgi:hypothetical protein